MTTRKKANPPADNPFEDGLLDWMESPAGEQLRGVNYLVRSASIILAGEARSL